MEALQNLTKTNLPTGKKEPAALSPAQHEYISYVAVSGLIIHEDGSFKKMTVEEFASKVGVSRVTLHNWSRSIPDFAQKVEQRRAELMPVNRVSAIWKGLTLKAMSGNVEAAKIVLGQYANWQPPAQKHEVQVSTGLADLVAQKKLAMEQQRKVIDVTPNDNQPTNNT